MTIRKIALSLALTAGLFFSGCKSEEPAPAASGDSAAAKTCACAPAADGSTGCACADCKSGNTAACTCAAAPAGGTSGQ